MSNEIKAIKKERKLSTWEVLRFKFPATECVLIEEVSDASGFSRSRSLDYMTIQLWESRGLAVTGIEKKTNRSDWLKELKNPQKQENHFKYCDYFYLLTDKEGVAKLDEIPETWGWYHINDKQILKTMKAAPKQTPVQIPKSFMCAMMRRAADKTNFIHKESIQQEIENASYLKTERRNYEMERKAKQYDDLIDQVKQFEEASGVKIADRWGDQPKKIGEAVRLILHHGVDSYQAQLQQIETRVKNIHDGILKNLETLNHEQHTT